MSGFEYFFTFYGLVLGLSVVELVAGFARWVEHRREVRLGWLTPTLAVFVALDISSYWLQAWALFRNAPLSMFLITHGLLSAGAYFVAASLIFPRISHGEMTDSDAHFWLNRRWIFGGILLTNVLNVGSIAILEGGGSFLGPWWSAAMTVSFYVSAGTALFAPKGRWVKVALIWLLAYSVLVVATDGLFNILLNAPWPIGEAPPSGD